MVSVYDTNGKLLRQENIIDYTRTASRYVRHKKFGEGVVMETKGEFIVVDFATVGRKQLNLQLCMDKGLMQFIHNS